MKRLFYLITFLIVYYNGQEPKYDVYTYNEKKFEIEVVCAEGVTDCKDSVQESRDREEEKRSTEIYRPYGSYYPREFPYVFIY